jgi:hypothetical protein
MMDNTVMPVIKQQIMDLKASSVIDVYHTKDMTRSYQSYTVPATIKSNTIGFVPPPPDVPNGTITMTYSYINNTGDGATFGSLAIDDVKLQGVPFFELRAKVVVTTFNELFIGDLALLPCNANRNEQELRHSLPHVHVQRE